jgi:hypothetical protein
MADADREAVALGGGVGLAAGLAGAVAGCALAEPCAPVVPFAVSAARCALAFRGWLAPGEAAE